MDVPSDPHAKVFLDLLSSLGLKKRVNVPTHISGHTLDLLITREHDSITTGEPVVDCFLSD